MKRVGCSYLTLWGYLPRVERRLRLGRGPVLEGVQRGQQAAQGVRLLGEGVLLRVVGAVLDKVAEHVGVAQVVQSDDGLDVERRIERQKNVSLFVKRI